MKKKKIKNIMIASLVVMILTVILSYNIESRSQKLPAVVRSEKIFISTEVSGTVQQHFVSSMQEVQTGDKIVQLENSKLPFKLQTLKQEREKYEELISSIQSGDQLKMELFELDEDIIKNSIDLREAELDLSSTSEKLIVTKYKFDSSQKQYTAQKKLFDENLISAKEFEEETNDYLEDLSRFNKLRNDSLMARKKFEEIQSLISLLEAEKKILNNNGSILASKYLIDLEEVNADINDLEQEISNLIITSPVNGIVTDIRNRPGENIDNGDVVVEISNLSKIWIIAYGNSYSSQKIKVGSKAIIYCGNGKKISGSVTTVSPVMEKVKALSSSFETVNPYSKIEIVLDNEQETLQNITPGERLFVRVSLK